MLFLLHKRINFEFCACLNALLQLFDCFVKIHVKKCFNGVFIIYHFSSSAHCVRLTREMIVDSIGGANFGFCSSVAFARESVLSYSFSCEEPSGDELEKRLLFLLQDFTKYE